MTRFALVATLLSLAACSGKDGAPGAVAQETDEKKLVRLRTEQGAACRPAAAAESALAEKYPMIGRTETPTSGMSLPELQANLARLKRQLASDSVIMKRMKEHPEELEAELKAAATLQTKCDLATRSLNIFMSGR